MVLLLALYRVKPESVSWIQDNPHLLGVAQYAYGHPFSFTVFAGIWYGAIRAFLLLVTQLRDKSMPVEQEHLASLLEIIERIVGYKSTRFEDQHRAADAERPRDAGSVFLSITQPERQIAWLTEGIWSFFNRASWAKKEGVRFRVMLAAVEQGKVLNPWFCYSPEQDPPHSLPEDLPEKKNILTEAIRKRELIIIPDVKTEAARSRRPRGSKYNLGKYEEGDAASLLCYPVVRHRTREVAYVVIVGANRPSYFKEDARELYELVLLSFACRIRMEHSLKLLKKEAGYVGGSEGEEPTVDGSAGCGQKPTRPRNGDG